MTIDLQLVQISDIHLGHRGPGAGLVLPAEAGPLLSAAVEQINARPGVDAVLLTGDLVDNGDPAELDDVLARLAALRVPWYAIPGNHDIAQRPDPALLDRARFFARLSHDSGQAAAYGDAGRLGAWTMRLKPDIRLVALDSNIVGDWAGRVDEPQLAWLEATLAAAPEPCVLLLVHHPLHPVFAGWQAPVFDGQDWRKFFARNGAAVQAVLDRHPAVRLVLSGHDHISQAEARPGRLQLAAPALGSYPLAYRTIQVQGQGADWTITWQTQAPGDAALIRRAETQLLATSIALAYNGDDPAQFARVSAGRAVDQGGRWSSGGGLTPA